jgi:hypothetical protein
MFPWQHRNDQYGVIRGLYSGLQAKPQFDQQQQQFSRGKGGHSSPPDPSCVVFSAAAAAAAAVSRSAQSSMAFPLPFSADFRFSGAGSNRASLSSTTSFSSTYRPSFSSTHALRTPPPSAPLPTLFASSFPAAGGSSPSTLSTTRATFSSFALLSSTFLAALEESGDSLPSSAVYAALEGAPPLPMHDASSWMSSLPEFAAPSQAIRDMLVPPPEPPAPAQAPPEADAEGATDQVVQAAQAAAQMAAEVAAGALKSAQDVASKAYQNVLRWVAWAVETPALKEQIMSNADEIAACVEAISAYVGLEQDKQARLQELKQLTLVVVDALASVIMAGVDGTLPRPLRGALRRAVEDEVRAVAYLSCMGRLRVRLVSTKALMAMEASAAALRASRAAWSVSILGTSARSLAVFSSSSQGLRGAPSIPAAPPVPGSSSLPQSVSMVATAAPPTPSMVVIPKFTAPVFELQPPLPQRSHPRDTLAPQESKAAEARLAPALDPPLQHTHPPRSTAFTAPSSLHPFLARFYALQPFATPRLASAPHNSSFWHSGSGFSSHLDDGDDADGPGGVSGASATGPSAPVYLAPAQRAPYGSGRLASGFPKDFSAGASCAALSPARYPSRAPSAGNVPVVPDPAHSAGNAPVVPDPAPPLLAQHRDKQQQQQHLPSQQGSPPPLQGGSGSTDTDQALSRAVASSAPASSPHIPIFAAGRVTLNFSPAEAAADDPAASAPLEDPEDLSFSLHDIVQRAQLYADEGMDVVSATSRAAEDFKAEEGEVHMHRFLDAVAAEAVVRVERDPNLSPASALMNAIDYLIDPPSRKALARQEEAICQLESMASELHAAADSAHGFSLEERVVNAARVVLHGDGDDADALPDLSDEGDDACPPDVECSAASGSRSPSPASPSSSLSPSSDAHCEEVAFDHNYDNFSDGAFSDDHNQDDGDNYSYYSDSS